MKNRKIRCFSDKYLDITMFPDHFLKLFFDTKNSPEQSENCAL